MTRVANVLLADGTAVRLRPITPADADALVALHARFSERTRYLRFFSPYPRIPARDLRRFVTVDHHDREALTAEINGQLVAVGRYERLGAGAEEAEVAFEVEDAHQGRGIGSVLLEHLAAAASTARITRFVAEVLPENETMLRVFADAGYEVRRRWEDGLVHLTFPIAPTERSREVQWAREQRAEAASIRSLLFPRGVAVYGVRRDGGGFGAELLAHVRASGFPGPVVVVHPVPAAVPGAYRRAAEAGQTLDLAIIAVPAPAVPAVVADAAAAGVRALLVISAGFAEDGPAGAVAQQELVRTAHRHGMRVLGPNCFGVTNTAENAKLNASFAPRLPTTGRVGLFSQSGAFGIALLAESDRRGVGLSTFVAAGNFADVSGNDLLQFWRDDPATDVILLYLESFGEPRKFARLARAVGRTKPLVAVASRARREETSLDEAAVSALFAHSGVIRVDTVTELFDTGVLLAHQPLPAGRRVGIVTNSTALGNLAASACRSANLLVAAGHPLDVGPGADAAAFDAALTRAARDTTTDALVAVFAPPAPPGERPAFAQAVARVAAAGDKPVVATFVAGSLPVGVPSYPSVEEAVRALARVVDYADWRREPTSVVPSLSGVDPAAAAAALAAGRPRAALAVYGINPVPLRVVDSPGDAVSAAVELGYPVALTGAAGELRHRPDLGAVWLNLVDALAVRRAYAQLSPRFGPWVAVQPMVAPGVACVVEVTLDPAFGPVVGFGLGGVATELLEDRAWRLAPLTERDALALIRAPKASPLLTGWRGSAPVDISALAELLLRTGRLADEQPCLRSLVLNPVLARPDGLSVLDAKAEIGAATERPDSGPRALRVVADLKRWDQQA